MDTNLNMRKINFGKLGLVFIFFFLIFAFIQFSSPNFSAPDDGYYHIKHSLLYWQNGIEAAKEFPYLQFSVLKDKPSDLWFLYHLILAPFISFFNGENFQSLIIGSKIAHSIFAAFIFALFYFILFKLEIRQSFFWTLVLFASSSDFIFRLLLPRPHILSVGFLLLAFYFILKEKYWSIFFLSLFYTLTYEVSFLVFFIVLIYLFAHYIFFYKHQSLRDNLRKKYLNIISIFLGIISGIFFHPMSLSYLYSGYFVIFSIILFRFFKGVNFQLGGEMYGSDFSFIGNFLLFILFSFAFVDLIFRLNNVFRASLKINNNKNIYSKDFILIENSVKDERVISEIKTQNDWRSRIDFLIFYLFCLAGIFFLISIFISRAMEYFAPFAVLFSALVFEKNIIPFLKSIPDEIKEKGIAPSSIFKSQLARKIYEIFTVGFKYLIFSFQRRQSRIFIFLIGVILISYFFASNIAFALGIMKNSQPFDKYKKAAEWIAQNSEKGDIIFNADWGDFPQLFFWNNKNYYIIGMDPTFMYLKDKEKYWQWRHITQDGFSCKKEKCEDSEKLSVYKAIKEDFNAKYIFINNKKHSKNGGSFHQKFIQVLEPDSRIQEIFQDNEISVYKIY